MSETKNLAERICQLSGKKCPGEKICECDSIKALQRVQTSLQEKDLLQQRITLLSLLSQKYGDQIRCAMGGLV